jgi:putative transcription antitermination factor YqgF
MYIWIDLWDKKCWIAIYLQWIIVPKAVVPRVNLINELKKIIKKYNMEIIVVWLPYDLYWKNLKQLNKTEKFIEKLKNIFPNKKIESIDERFTTFEADNILKEIWWKNKNWNKDDISASLILENYLNAKNLT